MKLSCFKVIILLVYFPLLVLSQGNAIIQNMYPSTYQGHSQNWGIAQDKRGILYFANNNRLIKFDGNNWDGFDDIKNATVWSVAVDTSGIIYVGGSNDFGFYYPNSKGKLTYQSLTNLLPNTEKNFTEIYSIFTTPQEVIFFSHEAIFSYSNKKIHVTHPKGQTPMHKMFQLKKHLIVRQKEVGLFTYHDNKLTYLEGTSFFADKSVDFVLEYDSYLLIGTRTSGIFKYYIQEQKIVEVVGTASEQLKEAQIYHATSLTNKTIAVATKANGIFIIDTEGNLIEHFNRASNLIDNTVWYIFKDLHSNLWAATDKGISLINYFSPFRKYDETLQLEGNVNSSIVYNDSIYVATTQGVYKIIGNKRGRNILKGVSFCISNYINKQTRKLLVGTIDGLYQIDNEKAQLAENSDVKLPIHTLLQSKHHKDILYAAGPNYFRIYKLRKGIFEELDAIEVNGQVRSIVEDKFQSVFLGVIGNSIYSFNINEIVKGKSLVSQFKQVNFLNKDFNSAFSENHLSLCNNDLLISTSHGIRIIQYQKETSNFKVVSDILLDRDFENNKRQIFRTYVDGNNRIWISNVHNEKFETGFLIRNLNNKLVFNSNAFKVLNNTQVNSFYVHENEYCLLSTNDGLFRFNFSKEMITNSDYYSVIAKVTSENGDTIFNGLYYAFNGVDTIQSFQENNFSLNRIPFHLNSLNFDYYATCFANKSDLSFSTFLVGFDEHYSKWSKETRRSFTNLYEGDYVFKVIAKDANGFISKPATYSFTIYPPWYRTIWAYLSYIILFILILRAIVKFNTKRLISQNDLLEKTVEERTKEIEHQKNEISNANSALKHQQQETRQSIEYALHIQKSILPDRELISEYLPNSFIYYKPKDIVSGDFYVFYQKQNISILAVIDCTGHGVPGALMSMLGSNILNQIINEKQIINPCEILFHLNIGVNQALKQNKNEGNDGMDLSIISMHYSPDEKNYVRIKYAGANRPLYLIQNNIFEEIKATKKPIGGVQDEVREYIQHEFFLEKGSSIYLSTDGFADQFGGEFNKKMTTKKFKEQLMLIQHLNSQEKQKHLQDYFESWKGNNDQVDDVCVIGVCV